MRIHVVFATVGRAALLARVVERLADQTRPADGIVISATCGKDVDVTTAVRSNTHVILSQKGLCRQRNRALEHLAGRTDIVVFLDDDFVPHNRFFERVEDIFARDQDIVGATGELLDDGIHGKEIPFDAAAERLDAHVIPVEAPLRSREALYGCNMAIRLKAAAGLLFDEALPLYGWQEDVDFTSQLALRGRLVSGQQLTGIHLGSRAARSPGKRLGYSQVANLVYMWRKGTMQRSLGPRLLFQNLASNALRSLRPEPHIDRRGRLWGNLLAIGDLMVGRIDPRRVERM